jgi:hypothetical protein
MIKSFLEYQSQAQFEPIQSFYLQDDLNRKVWDDDDNLKEDIREGLLKIAEDYRDYLGIDVEMEDIILTGSLANYNWSKWSDFDVHLVFDFREIDENIELVKKYLDAAEKVWKFQHDLTLANFPVELYCQDTDAKHTSTGVYSLSQDIWIKKPQKSNFVPDEDLIRIKSQKFMDEIKELERDLDSEKNEQYILDKLKRVWKKIKDARQAGLQKEGEFSTENLVFKLLRRNGYISRILEVKKKAYDKQFK